VTYVTLAPPSSPVWSQLTPVLIAATAKYVVQTALVDVAVSLQLRRPALLTSWAVHSRDFLFAMALCFIGSLGAIAAALHPLAVLVVAAPAAFVVVLMRERLHLREHTRRLIVELADIIDLRDPYTHGHSQRVAALAERVARRLRLEESQVELIREAARVHDVGKVGTRDHLLLKPGPLDEDERKEMERHAEIGHRIASRVPEFWEGAELVLSHHERYDGTGYPRGLKGDELPLEVSVIAVADSYDAMITDRPYRRALPWPVVRHQLLEGRGTQWHDHVVDALVALIDEERSDRESASGAANRSAEAAS
jgi:putative nucleotidyltransferase with HDIG domain